MKYGDIVKFNNNLGELVTDDKGNFLFHPMGFGNYSYCELGIVTESDITEPTFDEKIQYINGEFVWGIIVKIHCIGDYQIIEYTDGKDKEDKFHVYINFQDTSSSYSTLDNALIGAITQNKLEANEARWASSFIQKMLK